VKHVGSDDSLRCSFCHKRQDKVSKLISNQSSFQPRAYICDECIAVCCAILDDDGKGPSASIDPQTPRSGGDTLVPTERMSPGELQMRQLLLANRIELEIMWFEKDTGSLVSSVTLERRPDGGVEVSVNTSPVAAKD
jgi:hypothetical protein